VKTLLIFRHGKAQKDAPHGDKPRTLVERGIRDATAMGGLIVRVIGLPDHIVASAAPRAMQTAVLAAAAMGYTTPIEAEPAIYQAGANTLLRVVRKLPDAAATVLLVGHNPGLQELAGLLAPELADHELPTAGVVHLEWPAARWKDLKPGTALLRGIYSPRDAAETP
jgi:phosphohistidine phosphatase